MIEADLKQLIIDRFGSLSKFSEAIDMPWTTLDGVIKRGVNKANITSLIKICEGLNIDCESLYYGRLLPKQDMLKEDPLSEKEQIHIKKYRSLSEHGKKMADSFLNMQYEYEKEESMKLEESFPTITKTLYGYAPSAGSGNYLPDTIDENYIVIPDTPKNRKADYIVEVGGDSMEPEYMNGERVLVKKQDSVEIDEIGVFVVNGDAYIKQFKSDRLHSLNPRRDDIYFEENQTITCMGKVIGKL